MKKPAAMTYKEGDVKKISSEFLRNKLKLKQLEAKRSFSEKYPHVEKFFAQKGIDLEKIREHSAKIISTGAITGTLLLAPPSGAKSLPPPPEFIKTLDELGRVSSSDPLQEILLDGLNEILPEKIRPLQRTEEKALEQIFEKITGVRVRANLEGEHLNTTYGLIGAEQHLKRFPGDTLSQHGTREILKAGIAPGLGAWGYFAPIKSGLTTDLVETEKWYAVVQTLYLPDWSRRQPYLRDWYKYRKVLIVNTKNGQGVIAAIADSGPAAWTGKHFGGSPEVMNYLGGPRYKKGPVLVFFVDDPENKVPLGPVEYNRIGIPRVALKQI